MNSLNRTLNHAAKLPASPDITATTWIATLIKSGP